MPGSGQETFPVVFSTPYSYPFSVTGGSNNDFRITTPLTLDGPVTINTAGGSATLAGPVFGNQPPAEFDGIQANLQSGKAANNSKASANAGQMITLLGQGFSNSTLVQFEGVDDTGAIGTITRTGTANSNGSEDVV